MAKRMTLREANEVLKEQGIEVMWSNLSLDDFFSYYDTHYKPKFKNLEALGAELEGFFFEDIKALMRES